MEISRIQPNCSECALVVYSDKLNKKQEDFFNKFVNDRHINVKRTPKGNLTIEDFDKTKLWQLKESLEEISEWLKIKFKDEEQFDLIRDESYDDMIEEGRI